MRARGIRSGARCALSRRPGRRSRIPAWPTPKPTGSWGAPRATGAGGVEASKGKSRGGRLPSDKAEGMDLSRLEEAVLAGQAPNRETGDGNRRGPRGGARVEPAEKSIGPAPPAAQDNSPPSAEAEP